MRKIAVMEDFLTPERRKKGAGYGGNGGDLFRLPALGARGGIYKGIYALKAGFQSKTGAK